MAIILPESAKSANKKIRTGAPIRAPRSVEVAYRRALLQLTQALSGSTRLVGQAVNAGQTRAQVLAMVQNEISRSRLAFERASAALPGAMTTVLSAKGKEQVENMVKRSLGVDFAKVVDTPEIADQLATAQLRNAQLITKLPEEHWGRVVQAISDNYDGTLHGSLTQRLTKVNGISKDRAKLIARDQTAKLSGDLARIRQQDAGINSYLWRNSQDSRVVGNPGGRYPKGNARHGNHWTREGKEYQWDEPPSDGHPGQPILCRCRAEPVINLDKLNAQFI